MQHFTYLFQQSAWQQQTRPCPKFQELSVHVTIICLMEGEETRFLYKLIHNLTTEIQKYSPLPFPQLKPI